MSERSANSCRSRFRHGHISLADSLTTLPLLLVTRHLPLVYPYDEGRHSKRTTTYSTDFVLLRSSRSCCVRRRQVVAVVDRAARLRRHQRIDDETVVAD